LWRGSESDDTNVFRKALDPIMGMGNSGLTMEVVTISGHKSTQRAIDKLNEIEAANMANTIIISFVGMSNGLGPVLAAHTTIPVIAVPASFKSFHDDVYSSLRMPSDCPMTTIVSHDNAILAVLNILTMNNPAIYANRQSYIESLDYESTT
jgi:5-(carboxyamino)imidazole ribonucleotide mutase